MTKWKKINENHYRRVTSEGELVEVYLTDNNTAVFKADRKFQYKHVVLTFINNKYDVGNSFKTKEQAKKYMATVKKHLSY